MKVILKLNAQSSIWFNWVACLSLCLSVVYAVPASAEMLVFTKSIDVLTSYRERPLFSPSRRPPDVAAPVEQDAAPVASQPLNAVLLGVVSSTDGTGVAILRVDGQGDAQRVRIGDTINGWQLDRIETHTAIFKSGDESTSLTFPAPDAAAPLQEGVAPSDAPAGTIDLTPQ